MDATKRQPTPPKQRLRRPDRSHKGSSLPQGSFVSAVRRMPLCGYVSSACCTTSEGRTTTAWQGRSLRQAEMFQNGSSSAEPSNGDKGLRALTMCVTDGKVLKCGKRNWSFLGANFGGSKNAKWLRIGQISRSAGGLIIGYNSVFSLSHKCQPVRRLWRGQNNTHPKD